MLLIAVACSISVVNAVFLLIFQKFDFSLSLCVRLRSQSEKIQCFFMMNISAHSDLN